MKDKQGFTYCGHKHAVPKHDALAVETWDLSTGYPGDSRAALVDVNLAIPAGTCIALVGHNGAGKSTLLKTAAGLLSIRSGEMRIFGHPIGRCHNRVVYLPQRSELDWQFPISVERLVTTGRYVHMGWLRFPSKEDKRIVHSAMEQLDIVDLAGRQISQLSGGQQQRVLLARAIAQGADLFLLDEPLNAVDVKTREIVRRVLGDLHKSGKTVLVATHFIDRLSKEYDGAVYLSEGRQIAPASGHFVGMKIGKK